MNKIQTIGIISDTHDNLPNIKVATDIFNQCNVSIVVHCGDFVAPFALTAFKELQCPLIGVFGNCDGEEEYLLTQAIKLNFAIFKPPHLTEISGRKILITHKPSVLDSNIDIQLYGHTHKPEIKYGKPLVINPGEASGWIYNKPTIAILNLQTNEAEIIPLL